MPDETTPIRPDPPAEAVTARGAVTATEPTRGEALVARRTAESRATIPVTTLRASIDVSAAAALLAHAGGDPAPRIADLVVLACARALAEHPRANGAYRDGRFERYERVNVGVAVHGEGTLVIPTIFDADRRDLADVTARRAALTARVHEGTITPPELSGGTFTINDLGPYGVRSFEAVVVPGQAAVLATGAVEQRAVVREGAVVARAVMDAELSCDHRIVHGAQAAAFLARVRELLEAPGELG